MPVDIKQWLQEQKDKNFSSMNQEIVRALRSQKKLSEQEAALIPKRRKPQCSNTGAFTQISQPARKRKIL